MPMFVLYVIADRGIFSSDHEWLEKTADVAAACAKRDRVALQVRIKSETPDRKAALAAMAKEALGPASAGAFLNGGTTEATQAGYNAVHWPEIEIPTGHPANVPGLRAGASVHSVEAAARAETAGASFLVFGSVFEPGSKPGTAAGTAPLTDVAQHANLPVLAVGGITPERVETCIRAGAFGVAVVTGVMRATDPADAIDTYLAACEAAGKPELVERGGSSWLRN
ncbi:MAG TPA: thiamine phosphate synthase [Tepidiformaceae bacterium]|jgi:thiamine-phosphate pyrophosphorylase